MSESNMVFTVMKDNYSSAVLVCGLYCDPSMIDSEDEVIVRKVSTNEILATKKLSDCPEGILVGHRLVKFYRKDFLLSPDQIDEDVKLVYIKVCEDSKTFRLRPEERISSLASTSVLPMPSPVLKDPNGCHFPPNSFDRFGDDLSELILSYLVLEDKIRMECVSKQWQRLVFNKVIHIDDHLFWPKQTNEELENDEHYYQRLLTDKQMKTLLLKCKNLKTISLYIDKQTVSTLSLLDANCRRLNSIKLNLSANLSAKAMTQSDDTICFKVEEIDIKNTYKLNIVHKFPNLKRLNGRFDYLSDLNKTVNPLKSLTQICFESSQTYDFIQLVDKHMYTMERISLNFEDSEDIDILFEQLCRLKNLKCLDLTIRAFDVSLDLTPRLIALSQSCPNLSQIRFNVDNIDLSSTTNSLDRIIRLSIKCFQSENLIANISSLTPNLREFKLVSDNYYTNKDLKHLSRLKDIERLVLSSSNDLYHRPNDSAVIPLLDNCPKLRELELLFESKITLATIDKLRDLAESRPKERFRFVTMTSGYISRETFGNLSIDMMYKNRSLSLI